MPNARTDRRPRRRRQMVALAVSVLLSLMLGELAVRLFGGFRVFAAELQPLPPSAAAARAPFAARIDAFLAGTTPGLDHAWFDLTPPAPPRAPVPPELVGARLPQHGPPYYYVYNSKQIEQLCADRPTMASLFGEPLPPSLLVFDAGAEDIHPRYRYPVSTNMPSGLATNELGFRGPSLTLQKPPRTVRIACVGASTTVNDHTLATSYPEFVQHWLTVWARGRGLDLRFEVVNAGREGMQSPDLRAIVRQEVLPLAPDYVVYYEGANQFIPFNLFQGPDGPASRHLQPPDDLLPQWPGFDTDAHGVVDWLLRHSAIAARLQSVLAWGKVLTEPPKPHYQLVLPPGLDEDAPDLEHLDGVIGLGTIVKDLDAIDAACREHDTRFVLCTFVWNVDDGMVFDAQKQRDMFTMVNRAFWPLCYADVQRLARFQNRVFATWAGRHGCDLVDVAARMPHDPELFTDMMHGTQLGVRFRAWCVFEQLVPLIERDLAAGAVPNGRHADGSHPALVPPRRVAVGAK